MVKEIFLISDGLPFFHYAEDATMEDSDKVLLSSGFLGALKSFSETERSDAIESFSTGNEYFLFRRYRNTSKMIVCVFDRNVSQRLARKSLKAIHDLIATTKIPESALIELGTPEEILLKEKISELIARLFGAEGESERITELLEQRTDIPLAFLVSVAEKQTIAHFSRPRPLFREQQVREFFLLFSTLETALSRLKFADSYAYFSIQSAEYTIASVWSGNIVSVATGAPTTPEQDVLAAAFNMVHYSSLDDLGRPTGNKKILSKALLLKGAELVHEEGEPLSAAIAVFLSTLCTRINAFFRLLTRRHFSRFEVTVTEDETRRLTIIRKDSTDDFAIELTQFE
ncbi:MAG: hypothetical protein ACFFGZ_19180 [Candidatus Thorarchaeota archaeon]